MAASSGGRLSLWPPNKKRIIPHHHAYTTGKTVLNMARHERAYGKRRRDRDRGTEEETETKEQKFKMSLNESV